MPRTPGFALPQIPAPRRWGQPRSQHLFLLPTMPPKFRLCECHICGSPGKKIPLSHYPHHLNRIKLELAEKEAEGISASNLVDTLAAEITVLMLLDEGASHNQQNRFWSSRHEFQESARLPALDPSAVLAEVEQSFNNLSIAREYNAPRPVQISCFSPFQTCRRPYLSITWPQIPPGWVPPRLRISLKLKRSEGKWITFVSLVSTLQHDRGQFLTRGI